MHSIRIHIDPRQNVFAPYDLSPKDFFKVSVMNPVQGPGDDSYELEGDLANSENPGIGLWRGLSVILYQPNLRPLTKDDRNRVG